MRTAPEVIRWQSKAITVLMNLVMGMFPIFFNAFLQQPEFVQPAIIYSGGNQSVEL